MQSIKVTYPCCKFGFHYAFKQSDKNFSVWRRVHNVYSFEANIVTILLEEKLQAIRFTVFMCISMYVNVCMCIYIYMA